jgi:polysaccharide deacetylase 2 family uncharacterized protein YibQ
MPARAAALGLGLFAALIAASSNVEAQDEPLGDLRYNLPFAAEVHYVSPAAMLSAQPDSRPAIAIIIDDMGYGLARGIRAADLPGRVTYSFLPDGPMKKRLAKRVHDQGKEIMLHLPMQAKPDERGHHMLTLDMSEAEIKQKVDAYLVSIPNVRGVNNHEGGWLTQHAQPVNWVMDEIRARGGLYFVDSRTNPATVAQQLAANHQIPTARRDVFLDDTRGSERYVDEQFDKLLDLARERGAAIAIGHPVSETLNVLERRLAKLPGAGVQLLPVSQLLDLRIRRQIWQASSSRSRPVAKSSKPSLSSIY